jgi:MATE family multidrug resistance protein
MSKPAFLNSTSSYRDVWRVSIPLVVSMSTTVVMTFTDRVFLANYSIDAIAAALPAGITSFVFLSFFSDTAGYGNVFIAQYCGAGALNRVGNAMWQSIYFSMIAWLFMICLSFCAGPLFQLVGHAPEVQRLEVIYFRILCWGSGIYILGMSLSSFYTGRGATRPVMIIHFIGMLLNVPLDYALINGIWIFPELGILGAGLATVFAWTVITALLAVIVFSRANDRVFKVLKNYHFNCDLFRRLLRFGVPSALQFSLDVFAFLFFVFIVGRIGKAELAVTNIAISLDSVSFRPLIGFALPLAPAPWSARLWAAIARIRPLRRPRLRWSSLPAIYPS